MCAEVANEDQRDDGGSIPKQKLQAHGNAQRQTPVHIKHTTACLLYESLGTEVCGKTSHSRQKPNQFFAQVQSRTYRYSGCLSPDDLMTPLLPCAGSDWLTVMLQVLFAGCIVRRRAAADGSVRGTVIVVRVSSWQGVSERGQLHSSRMRPDRHSQQRQRLQWRRRQQQSC
jgi:hypothetical protein